MRITLVQPDLAWQDREANLQRLRNLIGQVQTPCDLLVLPEMFTTGFTMMPERFAEPEGGPGFQWMQRLAAELSAVVCGSIAINDNGSYYNRLYWVAPDGSFRKYDKRHLFRMGKEQEHYSAGNERLIVEEKGWKICPLICYDLRFPVWSRCRGTKNKDEGSAYEYDVLIYVANWPAARNYAWKHLLIARAIENQCYVVAVNRCGTDGKGIAHSGGSMVIGPTGEILTDLEEDPVTATYTLDHARLHDFRTRFPAAMDADLFDIHI